MTGGDRAALASGLVLSLALTPAAGAAQIAASGTALVSFVEHRVDIGYGVEKSSGPLLGAEGAVDLWSRLALRIRAAGGSLSTQAVGAQDRDLGELGIQASVVAVGSNYSLFFDRQTVSPEDRARTLVSVAVAAVSTVIGFGVLAFSKVPVLHAIGATVAIGALLALVCSAIFSSHAHAV